MGSFVRVTDLQSGLHGRQPLCDASQFFLSSKLAGKAIKTFFESIEAPFHYSREFMITVLRPLINRVDLVLNGTQPGFKFSEVGR